MIKIIQSGTDYHNSALDSVHTTLPVGVYSLVQTIQGLHLTRKQDKFRLPKKIYNNPKDLIDRWLKSWANSRKNMGILLSGHKGTGKTITAQILCNMSNMPVITITSPYTNDGFIDYITNPVFKNTIIFIDEFEKVYDSENTNQIHSLLPLLDGAFDTRLLFVLTSNKEHIHDLLTDRPGRIRYRNKYDYLTSSDIIEIVDDLLINKAHMKSVYDAVDYLGKCTMDVVTKIIEDVNLFDESALECIKYMNVSPGKRKYSVYLTVGDSEVPISVYEGFEHNFANNADETSYRWCNLDISKANSEIVTELYRTKEVKFKIDEDSMPSSISLKTNDVNFKDGSMLSDPILISLYVIGTKLDKKGGYPEHTTELKVTIKKETILDLVDKSDLVF